jgi:UDP-glucose 4-epimerase
MKIALVGGSGFVGRHAAKWLAERGHDVMTVARDAPGDMQPREQYIHCDLYFADQVDAAAKQIGQVDCIVWLAAHIFHVYGVQQESAAKDLRVMVESPMEFINALNVSPSKFVYISSIQVYGKPARLPVDEDHPTNPFTAYGVAKITSENYLKVFCKQRNINYIALRSAFIYGPGQHANNALPKFIARVRNNEPPVINGHGREVRDDVHVDDVAFAIECAINSNATGSFNVSSGKAHTLLDIANAVCDVAKTNLKPITQDAPSSWVNRWFSIEKARRDLGYEPQISFRQGIEELWTAKE